MMFKGFVLFLSLLSWLLPVAQQKNMIQVSLQISLDNNEQFQFNDLKVFIICRPDKNSSWEVIGSFVPDRAGRIAVNLPSNNWIITEISTTSPTFSSEIERYYRVKDHDATIIQKSEFYLGKGSPNTVDRQLRLRRSAALDLCIPRQIKSGTVFIQRRSDPVVSIHRFYVRETDNVVYGGLEEGDYKIIVEDSQGTHSWTKNVSLRKAFINKLDCPEIERISRR